jgi:prepilin-type processing-associated H-X9-DG protein
VAVRQRRENGSSKGRPGERCRALLVWRVIRWVAAGRFGLRPGPGFVSVLLLVPLGAAIIAPAFVGAREKARESGCISNTKQLVMAAKMFADDWDGVFPDVGSYPKRLSYGPKWTPGPDWREVLRDYLRAGDHVFKCPAVSHAASPSYAWNRHLSKYPEAEVAFPSSTPMCWDWVPGVLTAPGIALDPADRLDQWGFYPSGAGADKRDMGLACSRHGGGLILAFVDGHAQFARPSRWTKRNLSGRVMACDDDAMPWPAEDYRGEVVSMYPQDPMPAK